jgi:flagellar biosynthetic protein FliO
MGSRKRVVLTFLACIVFSSIGLTQERRDPGHETVKPQADTLSENKDSLNSTLGSGCKTEEIKDKNSISQVLDHDKHSGVKHEVLGKNEGKEIEASRSIFTVFIWGLFVLLLLVGFLVLLKKLSKARMFKSIDAIKILTKRQIGPKHNLLLVDVGKRVILVGITKDKITKLCEFAGEEIPPIRAGVPGSKGDSTELVFNDLLNEQLKERGFNEDEEKFRDIRKELEEMKEKVRSWKFVDEKNN